MYIEMYVHPSAGDDNANGTQSRPYLTVEKAVEEVRFLSNVMSDNEQYNINIMLGCGVNRVSRTVELKNINPGINLKFRPWDGMYTALSCAARADNSAFEYDEGAGVYSFDADADVGGLYINGTAVPTADSAEQLTAGSAVICKNKLIYSPRENEDIRYSQTELAGCHTMFEIKNCKNIVFENVDFIGLGQKSCAYIGLDGSSSVSIRECRFKNSAGMAVMCRHSEQIDISDCEFTGIGSESLVISGGSEVQVINGYFDSCCKSCISIDATSGAEVRNSTFSNVAVPVCAVKNTSALKFCSNRIEEPCAGECSGLVSGMCRADITGNCILTDRDDLKIISSCDIADGNAEMFIYNNVIVTGLSGDCRAGLHSMHDGTADRIYVPHSWKLSDVEQYVCNVISGSGYRKKIRNYGDII